MKFNETSNVQKAVRNHPDATTNESGGLAYKSNPCSELYKRVMTYMVSEPKFYVSAGAEMTQMQSLIAQVAKIDPEFILKLAAFARQEMYLRSAPVFLLVEACQYNECKPFIRRYTPAIIQRADEITEVLAYWTQKYGNIGNRSKTGSLPSSLKRGVADAFHNFDTYQFGKYKADSKQFKMSDAIRVTHPRPINPAEVTLFKQIRSNTIPIPDTWETFISKNGSTSENWKAIAPKMPYAARLRNLRNFLEHGVDMKPVIEYLTNQNALKKSRQFPFRFYSAYKSIIGRANSEETVNALADCLELSISNMPELKGTTYGCADKSGSMEQLLSAQSTMTRLEVACLFLSMLDKLCEKSVRAVFATGLARVDIIRRDSIISIMKEIMRINVGGTTNGYLTVEYLNTTKTFVDRIIIFTDEQLYGGSLYAELKKYKQNVNPNVFTYIINVAGGATVQIPDDEPNTVIIGGWSEKVFNFIPKFEAFGKSALDEVQNFKVGRYGRTLRKSVQEEEM